MIGAPGPENLSTLRAGEERLARNRRPEDLGLVARLGARFTALKKRRSRKARSRKAR